MIKLITTIIIDDQKGSIQTLKKDLENYADIKLIDTCTSPVKGKEAVLSFRPSLLFLDVEMPTMNGLDFLRSIQERVDWNMSVVFYSAFDKYILEAFRIAATDFLLKPYQPEELDEIIERVRTKQCDFQSNLQHQLQQLISINKKIGVQTISGLSLFKKDEVLYFTRRDNSWYMCLTNNQEYQLKPGSSHKDITQIASTLVLVNPSYIINLDYLAAIENRTLKCIFTPQFDHIKTEIFVSRRNYSKIKNMFDVF